jgi:hypothetical protein
VIERERTTGQPTGRASDGERIQHACRRILRPLVKVMIAHGVTLPAVVTLLKQVYVEVAAASFRLDGRPLTDSRISLLTGVHRKDVRTLRERGVPATAPPAMSVGATVIGRWLGDPRFADGPGRPRRLPRVAPGEPSFNGLVAEVSADLRPRTVLDELLRQGLVTHEEAEDRVTLRAEAFVPRADHPAIHEFFASNLHDHAAAAAENLLSPSGKAPFLERAVYYNGLAPASVDALEQAARRLALGALAELNAEALALQRDDRDRPAPRQRFRFGVYFYRTDQPTEAASEANEERDP